MLMPSFTAPTGEPAEDIPEFVRRFDRPNFLRRAISNTVIRAIDSGWTTRTPLQAHIVICGFPRAGTTLLALMLQVAYTTAKAFPKERAAFRVAYRMDRNHPLMISKRPDDIFYLDRIRRIYARRRPAVRFVLMLRDPRAVLTSIHAGRRDEYYVSPARWQATYDRVRANWGRPDCLGLRFEDLVTDVHAVQRALVPFIGMEPNVAFDQYVDRVPDGFQTTALNGVRALDASAASRWRDARHRDRLRAVLRSVPHLPRVLIESGYEKDEAWALEYR
jgi:hypothetical protein